MRARLSVAAACLAAVATAWAAAPPSLPPPPPAAPACPTAATTLAAVAPTWHAVLEGAGYGPLLAGAGAGTPPRGGLTLFAPSDAALARPVKSAQRTLPPEFERAVDPGLPFVRLPDGDVYAPEVGFSAGFPVAPPPPLDPHSLVHSLSFALPFLPGHR